MIDNTFNLMQEKKTIRKQLRASNGLKWLLMWINGIKPTFLSLFDFYTPIWICRY